jgi:hypothetical protein
MKRFVIMLMMLAAISPSLTGCFGKFALTRKVYEVNASVHDRYLRNVVTWAFLLVPVYWVSGVVDLFIFNTIEFWGGHNPMAAGEKSFHYASGDQLFKVLAVKNNDTISYTIDRYRGEQYLDSLVINCDLSGNNATATYHQPGRDTTYVAKGIGSGAAPVLASRGTAPGGTSLSLLHGSYF